MRRLRGQVFDEDLDSLAWDLEIDSAIAHRFDIDDGEDAAVAARAIYRGRP